MNVDDVICAELRKIFGGLLSKFVVRDRGVVS